MRNFALLNPFLMSEIENINKGQFIDIYSLTNLSELQRPMFPFGISAGFPSPATDFIELSIDLNKYLIKHPNSTFFGRIKGESMKDVGINDGDIVIIDKSIDLINNKIAVCYIDGEFTLKRIEIEKNCVWLMPANENYSPIKVTEDNDLIVWGIVTYVIKAF